MIKDKEKVEKIYNYLANLAKAHDSSSNKYHGWTLYNKNNKKFGFSVQHYTWKDNTYHNFYLHDVDFNFCKLFGERNLKRIIIRINIEKDFSELEIKECVVKDGAELFGFFQKLDKFVESYYSLEVYLEQILLGKIKGNK